MISQTTTEGILKWNCQVIFQIPEGIAEIVVKEISIENSARAYEENFEGTRNEYDERITERILKMINRGIS